MTPQTCSATTRRGALCSILPDDPVLNAMGLFQQDGLRVAVSGHVSGKIIKSLMQLSPFEPVFRIPFRGGRGMSDQREFSVPAIKA